VEKHARHFNIGVGDGASWIAEGHQCHHGGGGKIGSCAALQQQTIKREQNEYQLSSQVEIGEPVALTINPVASAQTASSTPD
jgi:hypothetical protein